MHIRSGVVSFSYATADGAAVELPEPIDGSFLSDEACNEGWFTGTMVGLCCQDLTGAGLAADFDWFDYQTKGSQT